MAGIRSFRGGYVAALLDYLRDPANARYGSATNWDVKPVSRQLSMLDLAVVHQEALLSALAEASGPEETHRVDARGRRLLS